MRRMICLVAAIMVVGPTWAQCCRSDAAAEPVAPAAVSLSALEHQVGELRWELHELNYSDIATAADKAAKRAALSRVQNAIERVRSQRGELALQVAQGLQQQNHDLAVSLLTALLPD